MREMRKGGASCVVGSCRNNAVKCKNLSFFRIPRDPDRARVWVTNCGRQDLLEVSPETLNNRYRVCGAHFEQRMFLNDLKNRLLLQAVPTIFGDETGDGSKEFDHTYSCIIKHFGREETVEESVEEPTSIETAELFEIDEVCRICLVKKDEMLGLGESGVENVLSTCASIQILEEDKSHFLCMGCLTELNKCHEFIEQVKKSFEIGHWLIDQKSKHENVYALKQDICLVPSSVEHEANVTSLRSDSSDKYVPETTTTNACYRDVDVNSTFNFPSSDFDISTENVDDISNIDCDVFNAQDKQQQTKCYECEKCSKQFRHTQTLNDHMKRHYNSRDYACGLCGKTFYKQFNVKEHMRIHTGERPFKCGFCTKTFTRALLLRNHIKMVHTNDKKFTCEICDKSFVDSYQLKIHVRTHTGEKPYQCSYCENSFALQGQLNSHTKYKHTKQKDFICNVCARAFTARHSLLEHLRTHTGEKREARHECTVCGKKCLTTTQLKIHVKSQHTGERPFPCQLCEKCFITRTALDCHMRTHTGEKTFICDECGKGFCTNFTLKIHSRIHSGERPYECNICCKKFSQARTLNMHMKRHNEGP